MKKKIFVFLTTLALLLGMVMPAYAGELLYGTYFENGNGQEQYEIYQMATSIYEYYGIEAYYIENDEYSGIGSAQQYCDEVIQEIALGENIIACAKTADDQFVGTYGLASDIFSELEISDIKNIVFTNTTAEQCALEFLNQVNGLLEIYGFEPDDTYTDDYALYEVTDDEMELQPYDEYNRVMDCAYLLSDSEYTSLADKLNEISERQQFDIVIVTVDDLQGYATVQEFADDIYDYNGYGFGENNDGCLLLISLEDNDWYISTTGYGITALTDAGIQYIGKQITPDLSDGDWSGAFNLYADLIDEFVTQAKNGEPYDNGNLPHSTFETIKAIIISLVIGVACAAIIMVKVKNKYTKAVHMNANAQDYLVNGSLQVTGSYDNFVYTNVTRTEIPQETSSSGSSTHSGSSGTTHGGGGGKF